jgi:hypothetical protein
MGWIFYGKIVAALTDWRERLGKEKYHVLLHKTEGKRGKREIEKQKPR